MLSTAVLFLLLLILVHFILSTKVMNSGGGGGGGGSIGGDCTSVTGNNASSSSSVVIIGGGLSGLTAALKLIQQQSKINSSSSNNNNNFSITILEARERAGGRCYSINGVDMGAAWTWPRNDRALSALTAELGVDTVAQESEGDALHHQSATRVAKIGAQSPSGEGSLRFKNGLSSLIDKLREKVLASGYATIHYRFQVTDIIETTSLSSSSSQPFVQVKGINLADDASSSPSSQEGKESISFLGKVAILALPPKLIARYITFDPPLPKEKLDALKSTPTWMENTGKVAFVYETAFWRTSGLSGTVFSEIGPLRQIWDNSITNTNVNTNMNSNAFTSPKPDSSSVSGSGAHHRHHQYNDMKAKELIDLIDSRKLNRAGLAEKSELIQLLVSEQYNDAATPANSNTAPSLSSLSSYVLAGFVFDEDLRLLKDEATIRKAILPQLVTAFGSLAANPIRIIFKSWTHDQFTHVIGEKIGQADKKLPFGSLLVRQAHGKRIVFAGTETVPNENGHMNGAVLSGHRAASEAFSILQADFGGIDTRGQREL